MEVACAGGGLPRVSSVPSLATASPSACPSPRPQVLCWHDACRGSASSICSAGRVGDDRIPRGSLAGAAALSHQGSYLVHAPLAPLASLGPCSAPGQHAAGAVPGGAHFSQQSSGGGAPGSTQARAVFQHLTLPAFHLPLWVPFRGVSRGVSGAGAGTGGASAGGASCPTLPSAPGASASASPNSMSAVALSSSSTSLGAQGTVSSSSRELSTGAGKSSQPRTRASASGSATAAAAVVASELAELLPRCAAADAGAPESGEGAGTKSPRSSGARRLAAAPSSGPSSTALVQQSSSWLVSFLVNYSLAMSAWWQFKHTAPAAVQQWLQQAVPPLLLPKLLALQQLPGLPHANLPFPPPLALPLPLPLLGPLVALLPPLPFNPLLSFALSPSAILRNLRAPWLPPWRRGSAKQGEGAEGETGSKSGRRPGVQGLEGEVREPVEAVVEDDSEPGMLWGQRQKDVDAEVARGSPLAPYGFSFSAAGLLFPYHLGATQLLIERGVLTSSVPLAGASAGAIVCAAIAAGVPMRTALEHTKALAANCRENGTAFRLGAVLRQTLQDLLPEDSHLMCNGRIRVAVTQVFGQPRGLLVDQFDSKEDLINALCTSSFIPGYLAPAPITRFRDRICVDGGLTLFIPPTASHNTVRICAFPASSLGLSNVAISPDARPQEGWSMRQLFQWALEPAKDEYLDVLFEEGYLDAQLWLDSASAKGEGRMGEASQSDKVLLSAGSDGILIQ